jgi:hypothetical protein
MPRANNDSTMNFIYKIILLSLVLLTASCQCLRVGGTNYSKYENVSCQETNESVTISNRIFKRLNYQTSHGELLQGSFWNLSNDSLFMFNTQIKSCSEEEHLFLFAVLKDYEIWGCNRTDFKDKWCNDIVGHSELDMKSNTYKIEHLVFEDGCFEAAAGNDHIQFHESYMVDTNGRIISHKKNRKKGQMYLSIFERKHLLD